MAEQFGDYPGPDPRMKKWLFLQLLGGVIVLGALLAVTWGVAQTAEASGEFSAPLAEMAVLFAGLAVHLVGRYYAGRLR